MAERVRIFRYCPFSRLADTLSLGWIVVDDFSGAHHSAYAGLVEWTCVECEPRWFA